MTNSINRRKGRIRFSKEILERSTVDLLKAFFSNFYPISICHDRLYISDELEYYGYSEHFDEVEEGTVIPEYSVEFEIEKDTIKLIDFKKLA